MYRKHLPSAPSILIILMGALGDVARGLCIVSHIKNHRPKSKISWLVEPQWAEVVRFHPAIYRLIVFNRPRGLPAVKDLYRELSEENFDITLDLQRHFKSGFFSILSRAKRRVGFHRRNAKEFNWLMNNEHIDYSPGGLSKLDLYIRFTRHLGLPEPKSLDFGFSSLDIDAVRPHISAQLTESFVAVVMGSSWDSKDWVFEGYRQLVESILESGEIGVVLLGDRSQTEPAEQLTRIIRHPKLVDLVGKTSLLELTAILKAARTAVGPDSGPGHLAGAVKTPYVSLFGPTDPTLTAPYGSEHLVVQVKPECSPCYKRKCPIPDRWCMRQIEAGVVKAKIDQALLTST
ncbi:lipopolysaccharide heptosyltransferase I [Desulfosarcina ovata subsp. sediminis]|uniref:Lipopolysaccharide heptosyltransferase I n=1 Tax=Desulfosarcina ovata subsp. sediminis TaxID=885957 RepID=A0A5K7ZLQ1_9BACT|nr:glycosyltransferase family 9 protein [Desulfosarcina ovata]BBO80589.1 lipopolysaccharide heptosyltransferase I [Desulfosarcina ovata subsp. sediminis]